MPSHPGISCKIAWSEFLSHTTAAEDDNNQFLGKLLTMDGLIVLICMYALEFLNVNRLCGELLRG